VNSAIWLAAKARAANVVKRRSNRLFIVGVEVWRVCAKEKAFSEEAGVEQNSQTTSKDRPEPWLL